MLHGWFILTCDTHPFIARDHVQLHINRGDAIVEAKTNSRLEKVAGIIRIRADSKAFTEL